MKKNCGNNKLRLAVLVKQVPDYLDLNLDHDSRIDRATAKAKLNSFCQRAVSKGVELASQLGADLYIFTMGPDRARSALQETFSWATSRDVTPHLVLVCDQAFAGSDTLATSHILTRAMSMFGTFDLILCGDRSLDSDTGEVPSQVAQLLGLDLLTGTLELEVTTYINADQPNPKLELRASLDHGEVVHKVIAFSPLVISCAERLCDPCKVDEEVFQDLDIEPYLSLVDSKSLGPGPWGHKLSMTLVGPVERVPPVPRQARTIYNDQLESVLELNLELGHNDDQNFEPNQFFEIHEQHRSISSLFIFDPYQLESSVSLLNASFSSLNAHKIDVTIACSDDHVSSPEILELAANPQVNSLEVLRFEPTSPPKDLAEALGRLGPVDLVIAPNSYFGREIAGRISVILNSGITGGAVSIELGQVKLDDSTSNVVCKKPDFGGDYLATIFYRSKCAIVTMATNTHRINPLNYNMRAQGPDLTSSTSSPNNSRESQAAKSLPIARSSSLRVLSSKVVDDSSHLIDAKILICVGDGVDRGDYKMIEAIANNIGASLVCTRRVCDRQLMPRSRQVGVTGRFVSPKLYLAVGVSGRPSHLAGVRHAGQIVAFNTDPDSPIAQHADLTFVGDWRQSLPFFANYLQQGNIRCGDEIN